LLLGFPAKHAGSSFRNNRSMLADLILELFAELPLMLFDETLWWATCPKCGKRLKHAGRGKTGQFQCVMCERSWRREGGRLLPVDSDS